MDIIPIGCPCCNKKLFEVVKGENRVAVIRIKCQRCRNIVQIKMENLNIQTEQIAAP